MLDMLIVDIITRSFKIDCQINGMNLTTLLLNNLMLLI